VKCLAQHVCANRTVVAYQSTSMQAPDQEESAWYAREFVLDWDCLKENEEMVNRGEVQAWRTIVLGCVACQMSE